MRIGIIFLRVTVAHYNSHDLRESWVRFREMERKKMILIIPPPMMMKSGRDNGMSMPWPPCIVSVLTNIAVHSENCFSSQVKNFQFAWKSICQKGESEWKANESDAHNPTKSSKSHRWVTFALNTNILLHCARATTTAANKRPLRSSYNIIRGVYLQIYYCCASV